MISFSINQSKKTIQNKSKTTFKQFWKLEQDNNNKLKICYHQEKSKTNSCQTEHKMNEKKFIEKKENRIKQLFYDLLEIAIDFSDFILMEPQILPFYHTFALVFIQNKPTQPIKYQPKFYRINFANSQGGAKILMKSNQHLHQTAKILQQKRDTYMYTQSNTPFSVIIGLTQQVSIQQVVITSNQMYSRTIKQFMIQGIFTSIDSQWIFLGRFKAEQSFNPQIFKTQNKIVRYIKLTVISCYQYWSYFTLTQIQINGKGLFADAVIQKKHQQNNKKINIKKIEKKSICQNSFNDFLQYKQKQSIQNQNLISVLINKIQKLQLKNNQQNEKIKQMKENAKKIDQILLLKQQYQRTMHYIIFILIGLAILIALSCVCFCFFKQSKKQKDSLSQSPSQLTKKLSRKSSSNSTSKRWVIKQ